MDGVLRCRRCGLRIDPVAAPQHPSCDDTPDAASIRRAYGRWFAELMSQ